MLPLNYLVARFVEFVVNVDKIVYLHIAKLDFSIGDLTFKQGQIAYIGSGAVERPRSKADRSPEHLEVWDNLEGSIVAVGLTIDCSLDLEQEYLNKYWHSGLLNKRRNVHKVKPLLYSEASEVFYLDDDGSLLWKIDVMSGIRLKIFSARKGSKAGFKGKKGYWHVRLNNSSFKMHRVVWVLANKTDLSVDLTVDHIDGNKSNNYPSNLRAVSQGVNNRNRKVQLSKLNIPRIRFSDKQLLFHVQWVDSNGLKTHKYFTMKPLLKAGISYEDAYNKCLSNAVEFNDNLVIN